MGQKKLIRFAEIKTFANVLQFPQGTNGKWNTFFKNENSITLELACGKGEYTVGLAAMYPQRNFIGVDVKGNRIWTGAKKAIQQQLGNAAFLRTQIDKIADYFAQDEIAEIWITFPDPQLRTSKAKKRLTHPKFLRMYQQFLKPHGFIHLKTDSPVLYQFTKTVIQLYQLLLHHDYEDAYSIDDINDELKIKTYYETLDISQSNRIYYLCFSLSHHLQDANKDETLKFLLKEHERQAAD